MKCIYLTFNDPNKRAGLFYSTHERIKQYKIHLESYEIYNINVIDNNFLKFIKLLLGIAPKYKTTDYFTYDSLKYYNIWIKRGIFSSLTSWKKFDKYRIFKFIYNFNFLNQIEIETLSKKALKVDYIMAHWGFPSGVIANEIHKKTKKPYFVIYHGSDINILPFQNKILYNVIKNSLKNAKKNIFVSKALLKKSSEIYNGSNGIVIYNGIKKEFILTERKLKFKDSVTITFIGNMNSDKRADKLGEIIKKIIERSKIIKPIFYIIGAGPLLNELKLDLYYLKEVKFFGHITQNEIKKYLEMSDLLILPSRNEGLPLVLLEALAMKVIPITSNAGGISEILEDQFIVKENTAFIDNFIQKVIDFMIVPKHPNIEIENFTWENLAKQEYKLIQNEIELK